MAPGGVLQLLDSAQGHPLQSWTIDARSHVTIGRAEENDVVLADPYVSRAHAYLQCEPAGEQWRLVSISRQQIVYQGETLGELSLADGMVFRLGQNGCYLRFGLSPKQTDDRATLSYDPATMPVFVLDTQKMQSEVSEIVDGEYFQALKKAANLRRGQRQQAETNIP